MGMIEIEGMEFYAYHGHFAAEQVVGNRFIVNVSLVTDCSKAALSDDLTDALDYQQAYQLIQEEMAIKSRLLEHVAGRILERFKKEHPSIEKIKIKISKLNPPMGGEIEKVSVTLER
jgi:7,8-dihydroneopterin aldolase/epimerase/oxygenase